MRVTVITPPVPIVTYEQAVARLKLGGGEGERADVVAMIAAATGHIDGPGGWLGRALGVQTLEARLDNFDCGSLRLPYPEIRSITSVKYVDSAGVEQTIASDGYELLGPSLVPAFSTSWPSHRWQREAVRVRYVAGYAADAPQLAVARSAILLMVADLYRSGPLGTTRDGNVTAVPMSTTVESLLGPLQAYRR